MHLAKVHGTKKRLNNVISKFLAAKLPSRIDSARDFMDSPQCQRNFKKMDQFLNGLPNTYTFIIDILVVTKGTEAEPRGKVKKVLERIDAMKIRPNFDESKLQKMMPSCWGFIFPRRVLNNERVKFEALLIG